MCNEMLKLRKLLDENGIDWQDKSDSLDHDENFKIERTVFRNKQNYIVSVIHGFGTYGGWNRMQADKGLLEVMVWKSDDLDDYEEPEGYLTAEEVIKKYS